MVRMRMLSPEEAAVHPARSQLTRSLGAEAGIQIDLTRHTVDAGDSLVLCTDGLWDLVSRLEMAEALRGAAAGGASLELVDSLVELALKRGAPDNVTAVVITVTSALPITAASGRRLFRRGRD
jgi:serine/threonine protein phosphatase PrpC